MIEKRLLFRRGRRVNKKYCMRWIAFSALIVLIFLSLATPVFAAAPKKLTYESTYNTLKDTYKEGETVYPEGTDLKSTRTYYFDYYDDGAQVGFSGPVPENPAGIWRDDGTFVVNDPGNWRVDVRYDTHVTCSHDFVVDAPEFSSIFALGAGMMFLICGAIYLGMRKHAVRKV
jgi:hypothetical protein